MNKIKKDDMVIMIAGKDKGRSGKVLQCLKNNRVIVEGVNIAKKHVKPNPNRGQTGGVVKKELSVHISNVAIYNDHPQKADRVGLKFLEDGKKVRYFKSTGELIDA